MNSTLVKSNVIFGLNKFRNINETKNDELLLLADKCNDLNSLIKEHTQKLIGLKNELQAKMNEQNLNQVNGKTYRIKRTKYKNEFNSALSDGFNNLDIDLKRKLTKLGLIKVSFTLNTVKYKEIKSKNEETLLDRFVTKRNTTSYLSIYKNNK